MPAAVAVRVAPGGHEHLAGQPTRAAVPGGDFACWNRDSMVHVHIGAVFSASVVTATRSAGTCPRIPSRERHDRAGAGEAGDFGPGQIHIEQHDDRGRAAAATRPSTRVIPEIRALIRLPARSRRSARPGSPASGAARRHRDGCGEGEPASIRLTSPRDAEARPEARITAPGRLRTSCASWSSACPVDRPVPRHPSRAALHRSPRFIQR
jgi:hypothetical protein